MLDGKFERGFTQDKLAVNRDGRIRKDDRGFFLMSLSENTKVYFEDFYRFLETTWSRALVQKEQLEAKLTATASDHSETCAFYRSQIVIMDLLMRATRRFYTDGVNLGVVMSPWCFGTVMLEKVEVYRDRISKGEVQDPVIGDYPYYTIKYIDETYKGTLLALFDFPDKAFQMRWQYSELLKKYSKVLTNITGSLQSVLGMIKNYGS